MLLKRPYRLWALLTASSLTIVPVPGLGQVVDQQVTIPESVEFDRNIQPADIAQDDPGNPDTTADPTVPLGARDGSPDLPLTKYDAQGQLPQRTCNPRCVRVVVFGQTRPVTQQQAPWQVSLWSFKYTDYTAAEYRAKPEWLRRHKCGGTLIAAQWVLTAAHCVTGDLADHPFRARIGSTALTDTQGRLFDVRRKFVHPAYDPGNKQNDIALLQIDPVAMPGVQPAELAGMDGEVSVSDESVAWVYGYGRTRLSEGSALLLRARIQVWSSAECRTAMRDLAGRINPTVLCALGANAEDSCQGDSGGPLMILEGDKTVQAGVVSWGKGCGQAGSPGVYANVASYLPWIWRVTGGRAGRPAPAGVR